MAAIFEAENTVTLKRAAIKWLHPHLHDVPDASRRLIHEARAAARVRHRHVVDIYDVVEEQGAVFLVMELLLGEPLGAYLARKQLEVHEVIALLLPAMRGVAAAHAAGVIHRDIKPDNIFLAREGGNPSPVPKVIDFGISRIAEAADGRLTRPGVTMGTPRYVSFEQLRGARDVDARADVFAFGVILYEVIVGRPPYDARSLGEQAISFITTAPPEPRSVRPNVPEALNALVLAAIAREPEDRLGSMDELITGLEPFASEAGYAARTLPAYAPRLGSQQTRPSDATGNDTSPVQDTPPFERAQVGAGATPTPAPRHNPPYLQLAGRRTVRLGAAAAGTALLALFSWLVASSGGAPRLAGPAQQADRGSLPGVAPSRPAPVSPSANSVGAGQVEEAQAIAPAAPPSVGGRSGSPGEAELSRETASAVHRQHLRRREAKQATRPVPSGESAVSRDAPPSDGVAARAPDPDVDSSAQASPSARDTLHRAARLQRDQF